MAKISIDLLPAEFKTEEIKRTRFYKISVFSVAVILLAVFLSSLTVALRILQSRRLAQIQTQMDQTEIRLSGLKNTQASLLLLKNRLAAIDQYLGNFSKQVQVYDLINELIPPGVAINGFSINQSGEVVFTATVSDGESVDQLIDNFILPQNNQGKIKQISMDAISRGRDGVYRLSLKIQPK
ncbi:hypothetical protein A3C26_02255 [Candidatus Daviesbacteria bacterium RIFCSPHIGHO2_02_FULL_39_12]|uniref:Fimbrial assembly protein n=2 Tax=Candidatus Daviesiibacteriota TaxID=1752718 RepID=A0A1F5JAG6_9BACT|nr:MAG: hypothetical protein A3C26_02255 [Candidatus Daviesbacteria bacterium RIFCSPHIGHO2_02_FULL_39_12]OGE71679.1 MAG: hypothetical protein A3H40_01565 [Candidatus Daviesbacteria bacterium RIFCSPLOWO2_02_FULL_38_15]